MTILPALRGARLAAAVLLATTLLIGATACRTDEAPPPDASPTTSVPTPEVPTAALPTTAAPTHMTAPGTGPRPMAPPAGSGHGVCLDANSALVDDAVASLGADPNGGEWQVETSSDNRLADGCHLDFVLVTGSGYHDATATSRVLLFHGGEFVGTVESTPYSYTSIAGYTHRSVSVRYRWWLDDDAFCCPTGGPTVVTATYDDGIQRKGTFPPS
ncbi:LppP/LprE family lipoprotein [Gordonia sp. SID5947]|uniref:LppP/LprE family lipoprotein n=1 Tax=Gordonia sp. SID5947 TaxID=2690315 RepID=UPI001370AE82|nr:LppP/LprE family lipoprotein [Gordonia sp. SID5947]MYR07916.1 LppP/LprE family lipoprotein [Gordonia sp. SID5947]